MSNGLEPLPLRAHSSRVDGAARRVAMARDLGDALEVGGHLSVVVVRPATL